MSATSAEPATIALKTLQFSRNGLVDTAPFDGYQAHLVRVSSSGGTPGPTLCGIDRFAKYAPGWSVGGGVYGPSITHEPILRMVSHDGVRDPRDPLRRGRLHHEPAPADRCLQLRHAAPLGGGERLVVRRRPGLVPPTRARPPASTRRAYVVVQIEADQRGGRAPVAASARPCLNSRVTRKRHGDRRTGRIWT